MKTRKDIDSAKDYIIQSLLSGKTPTELCKEFKCKAETLKARWSVWLPDYAPNPTKKLPLYGGLNKHTSLPDYITLHGPRCKRTILYRLLVELRGNFCEECGMEGIWNGKKLRLHVDHINGVNNDNREKNLRLLCPNCHSQTETYSGKNTKGKRNRDVVKR